MSEKARTVEDAPTAERIVRELAAVFDGCTIGGTDDYALHLYPYGVLRWRGKGYDEGHQTPTRDEVRAAANALAQAASLLPDECFRPVDEPRDYS